MEKLDQLKECLIKHKEICGPIAEQIEKQTIKKLQDCSLNDLANKDDFEWFNSIFQKYIYLLRHNQHHIGELARMNREWNLERIKWT